MWMHRYTEKIKVIWDLAASSDGITVLHGESRGPLPLSGMDTHSQQRHGKATPWRIFFQSTETKCITPKSIKGTLP
jgi:hypothetical protein